METSHHLGTKVSSYPHYSSPDTEQQCGIGGLLEGILLSLHLLTEMKEETGAMCIAVSQWKDILTNKSIAEYLHAETILCICQVTLCKVIEDTVSN